MKTLVVVMLMLWTSVVAAQPEHGAPASTQAPIGRAPLANVDDVEPAVDVGGSGLRGKVEPAGAAKATLPASDVPTQRRATPPETATVAHANPSETVVPGRAVGRVMDTLDLGTTSITGNQELPKVLYIVPWKKSDLGDLVGRPVNTLLDEVLEPVDPEVFQRQLEYYETLHGDSGKE